MFRTWLGVLFAICGVFSLSTLYFSGWDLTELTLGLTQLIVAMEYISNPKGVSS